MKKWRKNGYLKYLSGFLHFHFFFNFFLFFVAIEYHRKLMIKLFLNNALEMKNDFSSNFLLNFLKVFKLFLYNFVPIYGLKWTFNRTPFAFFFSSPTNLIVIHAIKMNFIECKMSFTDTVTLLKRFYGRLWRSLMLLYWKYI